MSSWWSYNCICTTGHAHKYVSLPYVQGLSKKLSGILKPFNIKIAPRNTNDLALFFKSPKDTVLKLDMPDVVYNIPCSGCTAIYIGTTKRPLKTRIQEHKKDMYNPPVKMDCSHQTCMTPRSHIQLQQCKNNR